VVYALTAADVPLIARTERSLARAGVALMPFCFPAETALAEVLANATEPLLLLQAGAWLERESLPSIPPSATGRPLVAYGTLVTNPGAPPSRAERAVPHCFYLEPTAAHQFAILLAQFSWREAVRELLSGGAGFWSGVASIWPISPRSPRLRVSPSRARPRVVALPELRYRFDPELRILQVVTTIQVGGAERVTLDLAEELNRQGQRTWVAALNRAPRAAFPAPRGFCDLSSVPRTVEARTAAFERLTKELHLDLLHAHLLSAEETEPLHATGLPVVASVHNMPSAWPRDFARAAHRLDLLISCCRAVEREIVAAPDVICTSPCRTAWNGIALGRFAPTADALAAAHAWREAEGWSREDFVIISVANPRKQKRLERIPEILVALQARLGSRRVRAIICGEAARTSADGTAAQAALAQEIERHGVRENVRQVSGAENVRTLLCAADAFLSTSAFEGLSLAQLEALAAGLPVVATDVGGAPEIAREMGADSAWYRRLPANAPAEDFAVALAAVPRGERASHLPAAFERSRMGWRADQLYRATLTRRLQQRQRADGLWIITNNFSMGGAQSSARRLLEKLHRDGVRVRAFTVQEERPTKGSESLTRVGISVTHLSPACLRAPATAVAEIVAAVAVDPPEAILFWNLITAYKLLLADALHGVKLFDVSPGEMYFQSLAQYFQRPLPALPMREPRDYGARLTGAVVKFAREKAVAEETLGCPVAVIRNGVELALRHRSRANKTLIIGTAARISPDKRLEDLIEALHLAHPQLPPYELHIAGRIEQGAGDYARALRTQAARLPVVWRGELPGISGFLQELDLFVMISEPAGCPNASLEAMAAGLPVLATDVGGAHEQILDRHTGRLTPRRDARALAEAILQLAHDPAARKRYGRAARAHVAAEFSLDTMAEKYAALCLAVSTNAEVAA
jgi:glycosyltransferase involved in cell wall biosynthesis